MPIAKLRSRCQWCGVFVRSDLPVTAWRVRVGDYARQVPDSPWNYWIRLLCPDCSPATDKPPTWQRVAVEEVHKRDEEMGSISSRRAE